ncbi:MAG: histidinol-phosphate transaminase, partial [Alphaproteobacteria bacterium]|nr:histidinol-phosphate transaminase [Alphaproteobacteria bacterium]
MSDRPRPNESIAHIATYRPGRSRVENGPVLAKLSANESPLGTSPKALKAAVDALSNAAFYPDGSARLLRLAIAKAHDIDPDRIMCGAGSDELLHLLAQAYLAPGTEAIV